MDAKITAEFHSISERLIARIEKSREGIIDTDVSPLEADQKAGEYLLLTARIADEIKDMQKAVTAAKAAKVSQYNISKKEAEGKTADDRKAAAEADPDYQRTLDDVDQVHTDVEWLKTHSNIFTNAHIHFRQIAKERQ